MKPARTSEVIPSGIITLTTDFGSRGGYVAAMKGVVLSIAPRANIVDISHEVSPHDVLEGAFVLKTCAFFFPPGTVHLAVVDPGVGSKRRLVVLSEKGHYFVAPDNGLLGLVAGGASMGVAIKVGALLFPSVSPTFHGRDILAPVAARLSIGTDPSAFGPPLRSGLKGLKLPAPRRSAGARIGEVIYVDRFGNLITNIGAEMVSAADPARVLVEIGGARIRGLVRSYFEADEGNPLALIGSHGYLEIAIREGSAGRKLKAGRGERVVVTFE